MVGILYLNVVTDPLAFAGERAAVSLFLRGDLRPLPQALALHLPPSRIATNRAEPRLHDCTLDWNRLARRARVGTFVGERLPDGYLTPGAYPGVLSATADDWSKVLPESAAATGVNVDRTEGRFSVATPRTCGAFSEGGGVKAGVLEVGAVNTPTTVWVSALDGRPLKGSARLLLTVLTDVQMTDAVYADRSWRELRSWGRLPRQMRTARTEIGLTLGLGEFDVYALSSSGRRRGKVATQPRDGVLRLTADTAAFAGDATYLYEIVRR